MSSGHRWLHKGSLLWAPDTVTGKLYVGYVGRGGGGGILAEDLRYMYREYLGNCPLNSQGRKAMALPYYLRSKYSMYRNTVWLPEQDEEWVSQAGSD